MPSGAVWLDIVLWAPALELEGGGSPEETLARWPGALPPVEELLAVVAGISGYFLHRGGLPDPIGLPALRTFQRQQSVPAVGAGSSGSSTSAERARTPLQVFC